MAMNPDPKPGRWILPLVVLGMVAFTYFFVRELPADDVDGSGTDTTVVTGGTGTAETTPNGGTTPGTTPSTVTVDPAAQAYFEALQPIVGSLSELQNEMAAVNGGFDAEPRTVEYSDAVDRLTALAESADGLVEQVDGLTPPASLASNHEAIRTAVVTAAGAADDALTGLQSEDEGQARRNAVEAFDQAVADLQTALDNARSAVGLGTASPDTTGTSAPPGTTTPPDTTQGTTGDG